MKKILVTGGFGFIGKHLIKSLLDKGHHITVVDNLSTGRADQRFLNNERVNFIQTTVSDYFDYPNSWEQVEKFDEIYHLAAVVGVKRVLERPLETLTGNISETVDVLEYAKRQNPKPKVFIASTSEVYGKNDKIPLVETDDRIAGSTEKLRWVYAESKACDEFLSNIYCNTAAPDNLDVVVARFFNVVGPGQSPEYGMVLPRLLKQAVCGEDLTVYDDGTQIRSFMHVEDCVRCVIGLMESKQLRGFNLFNIGNPDPIMIKELAWRIIFLTQTLSKIKFISYEEAYGKNSGFEDMPRRVPNIDKLKSVLGEIKMKELNEIIEDTIKDFHSK